VAHLQATDLSVFDFPRVLEQVGRLALQVEIGAPRRDGLVSRGTELQVAYGDGPRIENRLAGADPQKLDLAESDRPDCIKGGSAPMEADL
jgi:hypothetical protein